MENARQFLQRQIASYEIQLRAADQRRASFRSAYPPCSLATRKRTPTAGCSRSTHSRRKSTLYRGRLQDNTILAETTAEGNDRQTAKRAPRAWRQPIPGSPRPKRTSRVLQMRYTDNFPDVVAAKQQIAALRARPAEGPMVGPNGDPAGQEQIALKLAETKGTIAALQRQIAMLKSSEDKLAAVEKERPNLIVEYQNMDRDYNVLRKSPTKTCSAACSPPISVRRLTPRPTRCRSGSSIRRWCRPFPRRRTAFCWSRAC